jgi:group I intron endonuclease
LIGYLHLSEIQKIIRKKLKEKSGIYGFVCKITGKLYINSSINLSDRLYRYYINGTRSNVKLQNTINKYNFHNFIFIVFEYCEPEDLISREQFYIDSLKPEYNILKTAGSLLGFKHSADTERYPPRRGRFYC